MGLFGHGGKLSKLSGKVGGSTIGALSGVALGAAFGPLGIFLGASLGLAAGAATDQQAYNRATLSNQRNALRQEQAEIERQRKREMDQQRRENEQLMNSVSNLTNTSYSGVSSPSVDYDKYGDLG